METLQGVDLVWASGTFEFCTGCAHITRSFEYGKIYSECTGEDDTCERIKIIRMNLDDQDPLTETIKYLDSVTLKASSAKS